MARLFPVERRMVGPLLVLTLFVSSMIWLAVYYRHRKQKLAEVAERLGLNFFPAAKVYAELSGLCLTQLGTKPQIENCLQGAADGTEVRIFEYRCFFPKTMASHTVALLTAERLNLPRFLVRPRHRFALLDPFGSLAPPPILIRENFDRHWIVAGDDSERVRELFDDALIDFVETNQWWMEGDGNRLALYRWNHTVNHTLLEDFFHQAYKTLLLLKSRSAAHVAESPELARA
jgi:hypothetical protein